MLPAFLENLDPEILGTDNYVVLDFEVDTSHGDYGDAIHPDNGLLLASWKVGKRHPAHAAWSIRGSGRVRSRWLDEFSADELLADIEAADVLVAHNAKYELKWLRRAGLDLSKVMVFDTKLGEYVLLGNRASAGKDGLRPLSTSLDMCARRRGLPIKDPVVDIMMGNEINPVRMPRPWLQGRCEQDVLTTEALYKDQLERLRKSNRLGVAYARMLLTPVLAEMEFQGMALDPERVQAAYEEYSAEMRRLEAEMEEMTGGINWRSPDQVAEFLYETLGFEELRSRNGEPIRNKANKRWPYGKPKTDKDTLAALKAKTPEQRAFVKLRGEIGKVGAALSKNLEFFRGVVEEMGGVFYAVFNQTTTATHRLSSSGIPTKFEMFDDPKSVQFQNLPNKFKPLFRAKKKGWKVGEADGATLEFRVGCQLGRCEGAKDVIVNHKDVHALSMSVKHSLSIDELSKLKAENPKKFKTWRTGSKRWTFQPMYGGEGKSRKQKQYAEAFREAYPGIAGIQQEWAIEVLNSKKLVTPWGLRYYWPHASASRDGRLNVKTSVYNYPIQGFATAEIMQIAVVYFWHRVYAEGLQDKIVPINTIHDNILAEIHPDHEQDFERIAMQAFTFDVYNFLEVVYGYDFDFVPLGVGIVIGDHWTEGEEKALNVYRDGTIEEIPQ